MDIPAGTQISVRVFDLAVLMYNLKLAIADEDIGNQHIKYSDMEHMSHMNRRVVIRADFYESALWASNMLEEKGNFQHPDGLTLKDFITRSLNRQGYSFNRDFNWIEAKEKKNECV